MKKTELSYYTLYLVNKERKKKGKEFYTWGHSYEKGSLTRAKDLVTQTKKSRNKRKNITNLPQRKIDKIIHGFGEAAELAVKAGFDMVQRLL